MEEIGCKTLEKLRFEIVILGKNRNRRYEHL